MTPVDLAGESDRLVDFARSSRVAGGFAWLDDDGVPDRSQPLRLWITARMTHVFALGHLLGRPGCAELVDHGLAALSDPFKDSEAGGWFAALRDGRPVGTDKSAYEHAFVLLAASSAEVADRPGGEARVIVEAIGAAAALHAVTGEEEYDRWYRRFWDYAEAHLVDVERGSWRHELDAENRPADRTWHGKPDVYHAFQATLVPRLPLAPTFARALRDGALRPPDTGGGPERA